MVKLYLSESFLQSSLDALQIHGGYGYMTEYELEREVRDAVAQPHLLRHVGHPAQHRRAEPRAVSDDDSLHDLVAASAERIRTRIGGRRRRAIADLRGARRAVEPARATCSRSAGVRPGDRVGLYLDKSLEASSGSTGS